MTVIRMGEALERLDGDEEIYVELIGTYLEMGHRDIAELVAKEKEKDPERVQFLAHKVKGASLTIGADDLAKACAAVEIALKTNLAADVASEVSLLMPLFLDTEKALIQIRDTLRNKP